VSPDRVNMQNPQQGFQHTMSGIQDIESEIWQPSAQRAIDPDLAPEAVNSYSEGLIERVAILYCHV
jgi:hypothetical protein